MWRRNLWTDLNQFWNICCSHRHYYVCQNWFENSQRLFHLSAWKNRWEFSNHFFHTWLRRRDLQTCQKRLRSVHRWRLHVVVKCNTFVTFVLPFFRFLSSRTGRNSEPIRTLNGSNDVFCLVHVPFGGLMKLWNLLLRGLRAKKPLNFDPFSDWADLHVQRTAALALQTSRVNYP